MFIHNEIIFVALIFIGAIWMSGFMTFGDRGYMPAGAAIFGSLLGLAFLILVMIFGIMHKKNETQTGWYEMKVISTADGHSKTSGSFVLGSGDIKEMEYYYANVLSDGGAIDRKYIPVEETTRYVDKNLTNTARYLEPICTHEANWLFRPSKDDTFVCQYTKGKLYIPENTIYQKINAGAFQ